MIIGPFTAVAIYLIVWWVVLFTILPLGAQSHAEAGVEVKDGGDPGAPLAPNLKRKFLTTTWVAAVVWVLILAVIQFGIVPLPDIPGPTG